MLKWSSKGKSLSMNDLSDPLLWKHGDGHASLPARLTASSANLLDGGTFIMEKSILTEDDNDGEVVLKTAQKHVYVRQRSPQSPGDEESVDFRNDADFQNWRRRVGKTDSIERRCQRVECFDVTCAIYDDNNTVEENQKSSKNVDERKPFTSTPKTKRSLSAPKRRTHTTNDNCLQRKNAFYVKDSSKKIEENVNTINTIRKRYQGEKCSFTHRLRGLKDDVRYILDRSTIIN